MSYDAYIFALRNFRGRVLDLRQEIYSTSLLLTSLFFRTFNLKHTKFGKDVVLTSDFQGKPNAE